MPDPTLNDQPAASQPSMGAIHPSHVPAPPKDYGSATGLVWCMACGFLLSSDSGPSKGKRAYAECRPVIVDLR